MEKKQETHADAMSTASYTRWRRYVCVGCRHVCAAILSLTGASVACYCSVRGMYCSTVSRSLETNAVVECAKTRGHRSWYEDDNVFFRGEASDLL